MALVRRVKPWEYGPEVLMDFLVEHKWLQPLDKPVGRYYRKAHFPAHKAVTSLICTVHHSVVMLFPIPPMMITLEVVMHIHQQQCSESPDCWTHVPPILSLPRHEKPASAPPTCCEKAPSTPATSKELKAEIKSCITQSRAVCITYNLGLQCTHPQLAVGCSFKKGSTTMYLKHLRDHLGAMGVRCKQLPSMTGNH